MKGILFASFGTSHPPARVKQIDAVAAYLGAAVPGATVAQAYTSNMVRRILEKQGVIVPDVPTALRKLAGTGVTDVAIQPGHLLPGEEYEKLCGLAEGCRGLFGTMKIGKPLLAGDRDIQQLAEIVAAEYPQQEGTALVLMGHGTHQFANAVYAALDYRCKDTGRDDIYVGTVEAYPGLANVMRQMQRKGYKNVLLAPLMLVAGDHALNDMAGDDANSWASRLRGAGYTVQCRLTGLGELPAVQAMYLAHLHAAMEE